MAALCLHCVHVYINWVIFSLTCAVSLSQQPWADCMLGGFVVNPREKSLAACFMLLCTLSGLHASLWFGPPSTSLSGSWRFGVGESFWRFHWRCEPCCLSEERSFLQKERNGRVCRLESYLKHVDVFGVFETSTQPDDLLCWDVDTVSLLGTLWAKYNQLLHKVFFYFETLFLAVSREHEYPNVVINLCFHQRSPNEPVSDFIPTCLFISSVLCNAIRIDAPNWQTFFHQPPHLNAGVRQVLKIPQGWLSTNNTQATPLIGSELCVCEWCSAQQLALASRRVAETSVSYGSCGEAAVGQNDGCDALMHFESMMHVRLIANTPFGVEEFVRIYVTCWW